MRSGSSAAGRACWSRSQHNDCQNGIGLYDLVLKWQPNPFFFYSFAPSMGILRGIPQWRSIERLGGTIVSLLLGVAGFAYAVLFLGFWSLGRMSALSDKFVESRANVIPFRRG